MVTVFGLGFVGLTTALGFAHLGYDVYGIDVDTDRKTMLREGKLPFLEPHMEEVLQAHQGKNFFITEEPKEAVAKSDYIFYCVGTPYGTDGQADLTHLFAAIDTTVEAIEDERFRVFVTKSTIPPSTTTEKIVPYIAAKGAVKEQIGIVNNPEFLREGKCWEDFIHADRIVFGCADARSAQMMETLYAPMEIPMFCVSHNTGEFIKYLSNTLLATLISYSNEMSEVADAIGGIDTAQAFRILHMDKRWGGCNMASYAYPGCGYGGYCLPKDTSALYAQAKQKGYEPKMLGDVIAVNEQRFAYMAGKIAGDLERECVIGVLGLSFKPDSDDVRDTPSAKIIRCLREAGYQKICAYDPAAGQEFQQSYPELEVVIKESAAAVCEEAAVIAIITAWPEFKSAVEGIHKRIIDCRYML